MCQCGDPQESHEHYRGGTECSTGCGCPRFRRMRYRVGADLAMHRALSAAASASGHADASRHPARRRTHLRRSPGR